MNQFARDVIADIISEHAHTIRPLPPRTAPAVLPGYDRFEANNAALLPPLDQSDRARAVRTIDRIACMYRWQAAVERALDRFRVSTVEALSDAQVFELRDHMQALLDGAMTCCDLDDDLPAR